ncbi:hypothetical protein [Terrimonas sp.]|uniref:hypothetical protein n=1 Tax=Terrimonas sp. TaxID=1914338 RepID=UPI001980531C|nr:hypothetical protein [Terrimonas sp.]
MIAESEPPNLFNTGTGNEQALVIHRTKIETGAEQAQEPYINISKHNKQNIVNEDKQAQKKEVQKVNGSGKKEKSSAKKERNVFVTPQLAQVQQYFASQKFPTVEASKFYNYFQSNGWLVGGRTKMKDWQAAARNWILNAKKLAGGKPVKPKAKHLHATTNKNYSEPL